MSSPPSVSDTAERGGRGARPAPVAAGRRRDKPQLSCIDCRRRKSRCDRQQPCANCRARGQPCAYAGRPPAARLRTAAPSPAPGARDLQDRLAHLERLVLSLKAAPTLVPPSPGGPDAAVTGDDAGATGDDAGRAAGAGRSECGSMRAGMAAVPTYVGSDHWAAIVDSIAELRDHVDGEEHRRCGGRADHADAREDDGHHHPTYGAGAAPPSPRALLLYGCPPASRVEILAALPPKAVVDRHVSRYFNQMDLVSSAVHGPTFLQEYEAFWAHPTERPILWLGLLFGMVCLAVMTSAGAEAAEADRYREKVVQCLVAGEYTQAGPYVLETLIHYVYIEFLRRPDADADLGLLLALEVHTALRLGYHRDPGHFPAAAMTPLEAEMRRRRWVVVLQGDVLLSSQLGLPRLVPAARADTAAPRNLDDADLDAAAPALPPARPADAATTATGPIARRRLLVVVGAIADLAAGVPSSPAGVPSSPAAADVPYADVLRLDAALHAAVAALPPPLRFKALAASLTDPPGLIMARVFLRHLFYRGQMLLHRRFLDAPVPSPDPYAYSRRACLDAALGSLQLQQALDEATRAGGQLDTLRWRVTSILHHEFLTATLILCAGLYRGILPAPQRAAVVAALRAARALWGRRGAASREARRAADAVRFVLARTGEGAPADDEPPNPSRDDAGVGPREHHVAPDAETAFTSPASWQTPPFWGAFMTSPPLGEPDYVVGMDTIGTEDQALHEWMTLNWPPGAI